MKSFISIFLLFLVSCARVPVQSIELSEALRDEGERMHQLNLVLVDRVFQEKRYLINEFITKEYTPEYVNNFKKLVPPGTDYEENFGEIMQAIYPRINARRDSLFMALEEQKGIIIGELNKDFKVYSNAFTVLQNLLRSASALNDKRTEVYQQIKELTGSRLDLLAIDRALNNFIKGAGHVGDKVVLLNNTINEILK